MARYYWEVSMLGLHEFTAAKGIMEGNLQFCCHSHLEEIPTIDIEEEKQQVVHVPIETDRRKFISYVDVGKVLRRYVVVCNEKGVESPQKTIWKIFLIIRGVRILD